MNKARLALSIFLLGAFGLQASDHIDGPLTQKHRVADLTDFFAYPTPNKPGYLSLILNTYPIVSSVGHFTDKATYVFLIRKAAIAGNKENSKFSTSDEIVINCSFQTPNDISKHVIKCKSTNGLAASSRYNVVGPKNPGDDFRLYAGMRSDPFFFNSHFVTLAAVKEIISSPSSSNTMAGSNVLSIVIEIEMKKLYPNAPGGMLALATEVITKDSPTAPLRVLDRVGRPEITNISLKAHAQDSELRDRYNLDRPFMVVRDTQTVYEARFLKNVGYYDALEKKTNWVDAEKLALSKLLADDFLVLDLDKACTGDNFLEIEKSMLQAKVSTTCGGRRPTDDIIDKLFSIYIGGLNGARIRDGIDQPNKALSADFPYLVAPSLDFVSLAKAKIARLLLGLSE